MINGEKIKILLIIGAQQCSSKIFIVNEIEESQLGVSGARVSVKRKTLTLGQNPDSDSTPLFGGISLRTNRPVLKMTGKHCVICVANHSVSAVKLKLVQKSEMRSTVEMSVPLMVDAQKELET